MAHLIVQVIALLAIGFFIYSLWQHIKKQCQRDKRHAQIYGDDGNDSESD